MSAPCDNHRDGRRHRTGQGEVDRARGCALSTSRHHILVEVLDVGDGRKCRTEEGERARNLAACPHPRSARARGLSTGSAPEILRGYEGGRHLIAGGHGARSYLVRTWAVVIGVDQRRSLVGRGDRVCFRVVVVAEVVDCVHSAMNSVVRKLQGMKARSDPRDDRSVGDEFSLTPMRFRTVCVTVLP